MKILVVDDEDIALTILRRLLKRRGYRNVDICSSSKDAVNLIKEGCFDIVILDLLMPGMDGLQVLKSVKPYVPETEFIMLTAVHDISMAVQAIRLGAYDYLTKPVENEKLFIAIERAFERKGLIAGQAGSSANKKVEDLGAFAEIITQSPRMLEILSYAKVMASSDVPVLITGESGTGKELLARAIHRSGPAPEGPFVAVNVASIAESMSESQLFGYVKGAFTGATQDYPGFFEQANGGTILLDEIGELPQNLQAKFLRVLEDKMITRLGSSTAVRVNFRIVAATNTNLDKACRSGDFRLDLYYRLKTAAVHLPPIDQRTGDIPLLANHFLKLAAEKYQKDIKGISAEALHILQRRQYPGNIRELAQLIEHAVLISEDSVHLLPSHLGVKQPVIEAASTLCSFKEASDRHLLNVLRQTRGNTREAAEILGVTIRQVQRKISQLKTDPDYKSILKGI